MPPRIIDLDDDDAPLNGAHAPESFETARVPVQTNGVHPPASFRTLPHSIEAEESLISCCLLDASDVMPRCIEAHLSSQSFYAANHAILFGHLLSLHSRQIPIDISIVAEELKSTKELDRVGGYTFLTQVSARIPTTAQAPYFIEKVREQALLRELIRTSTSAVEDCYNFSGDIEDFLTGIRTRVGRATDGQIRSLSSRKFNPAAAIVDERVALSLGKVSLSTAGNLTNIVAVSGVGKSAVLGAIIAASFITGTDNQDCLGFNGPNYARLPLLHFDTEQSLSHYQRNLRRALTRSGLTEFPDWFHSYHLTGLPAAQCRHAVESLTAHHARQSGGIFSLLIDGWADLVVSPNDERECFPFVTRMHDLAIQHDMPVIGVLHLNPVSKANEPAKGRGHLGSHLDRKAETVLQLEMDADGVTCMFTTKKRGVPIPKSSAPSFRWSEQDGMHRSTATAQRVKPPGGRPPKFEFKNYKNIFPVRSTEGMELAQLSRTLDQNGAIPKKSLPSVLERWHEDGCIEIIRPEGRPTRYRMVV